MRERFRRLFRRRKFRVQSHTQKPFPKFRPLSCDLLLKNFCTFSDVVKQCRRFCQRQKILPTQIQTITISLRQPILCQIFHHGRGVPQMERQRQPEIFTFRIRFCDKRKHLHNGFPYRSRCIRSAWHVSFFIIIVQHHNQKSSSKSKNRSSSTDSVFIINSSFCKSQSAFPFSKYFDEILFYSTQKMSISEKMSTFFHSTAAMIVLFRRSEQKAPHEQTFTRGFRKFVFSSHCRTRFIKTRSIALPPRWPPRMRVLMRS